ncbi:MAG TPA: hypothetical protein VFG33_07435 [Kribbella sp.]|uniref:CAP domain-containing protein n=1 Tax=Kribbella sp. TaxID=1871183 RepID=UPI002D7A04FF|nr:hypothetical protein [Kribbella sp.]HET6293188.1 hypothetical protein [Kribbella sp.]
MSERGAGARRRQSRRPAQPAGSRGKRILVAIGTVVLVITPISWILLHQPQADNADASVPYVSRPDDTYITASTDPVSASGTPPAPGSRETVTPTPGATTSTPPTTPATPGATPSTGGPMDRETTVPTTKPGETTTPTDTPSTGSTANPKPTGTTTTTTPPSTTPPPPEDDGNMDDQEQALFSKIDSARQSEGCAPLRRNNALSDGAENEAQSRAEDNDFSASGSEAAAGGEEMSADAAYKKLMDQSSGTLLNCGLKELGVGNAEAEHKGGVLCGLGICTKTQIVGWVADFN